MALLVDCSREVLIVPVSIIVIAREGEEGDDKCECDGLGSDSERAILEMGRGLVLACCRVCPLGESFAMDEDEVASDEDCIEEDFNIEKVGSDWHKSIAPP